MAAAPEVVVGASSTSVLPLAEPADVSVHTIAAPLDLALTGATAAPAADVAPAGEDAADQQPTEQAAQDAAAPASRRRGRLTNAELAARQAAAKGDASAS